MKTSWRVAQRLCLIGGLFALGFTGYTYAARYAWQKYDSWRFDSIAARRSVAGAAELADASQSLIGRITIPRLGISAMIREGVDDQTLDLAVGHMPSTPLPGHPGNVAVAAHRDNLFRNLKDVRQDDTITLTTVGHNYQYRVVSFRIVSPTDMSVLSASPDEKILTLITCYPFYFVGHASRRFIVRARQIS
jgi:sortase A